MTKHKRFLAFAPILIVVFVLVSVLGLPALAQSEDFAPEENEQRNTEQAAAPAQLYGVSTKLRAGTVVQPDPADSSKVVPATGDKLVAAFGIVIPDSNLPISLGQITSDLEVYVSTTGRHDALVTNEGGTIEAGDYLAVSSLSGTLMKAKVEQDLVFAKALAGFDGKGNVIGTTTLKDTSGKPHQQIGIGLIPVAIEIIGNPDQVSTEANLPAALQRIGQAIAEKPVDPIRIYVSMAVVAISIIIAITMLIVGVRNSIISIGRNPLSKKSIFKGLLQVILTSVIVLIIGLFTVYLLLRL